MKGWLRINSKYVRISYEPKLTTRLIYGLHAIMAPARR